MKPGTKASLIGISLAAGILIGAAGTLLLSSDAKAGKPGAAPQAQAVPSPVGDYLPAQFYNEQRAARQQELPPQF